MAAPQEMMKVPRDEFEALVDSNTQLKALTEELIDKVAVMESAALSGIGHDPDVLARQRLGTTVVQFTRPYNRIPQPSLKQKGADVFPGYSVGENDVVRLRNDEVERLMQDQPDLLRTSKKDFVEGTAIDAKPAVNKHGQAYMKRVRRAIPVEDLIKSAPLVG